MEVDFRVRVCAEKKTIFKLRQLTMYKHRMIKIVVVHVHMHMKLGVDETPVKTC